MLFAVSALRTSSAKQLPMVKKRCEALNSRFVRTVRLPPCSSRSHFLLGRSTATRFLKNMRCSSLYGGGFHVVQFGAALARAAQHLVVAEGARVQRAAGADRRPVLNEFADPVAQARLLPGFRKAHLAHIGVAELGGIEGRAAGREIALHRDRRAEPRRGADMALGPGEIGQ